MTITSTAAINLNPIRVGMVAGEASGDTLGVHLMHGIRKTFPNAIFEGIGGEQMIAAGFTSHYPMETLSVMGLVEVLKRIRQLFAVRDGLVTLWQDTPVDVFVGIDAPDFNLRLSSKLKPQGIPCVQYVSPSVWAWRQGRVVGIGKAVDKVLCLFPFEVDFYTKHSIAADFVGHPLASLYALDHQPSLAKAELSIPAGTTTIALLPGSRSSEVNHMLPVLLATAEQLLLSNPHLRFNIPASNSLRAASIESALASAPQEVQQATQVLTNNQGQADIGRKVMAASDIVILSSGTATLEALLLARPMVVIYKVHWLTFTIINAMLKTPYVALPNILAGRLIVPELIQKAATVKSITAEVNKLLLNPQIANDMSQQLSQIHANLQSANASCPSESVLATINSKKTNLSSN